MLSLILHSSILFSKQKNCLVLKHILKNVKGHAMVHRIQPWVLVFNFMDEYNEKRSHLEGKEDIKAKHKVHLFQILDMKI